MKWIIKHWNQILGIPMFLVGLSNLFNFQPPTGSLSANIGILLQGLWGVILVIWGLQLMISYAVDKAKDEIDYKLDKAKEEIKTRIDDLESQIDLLNRQQSRQSRPHFDESEISIDDMYEDAREAVISAGKASTSYLQRKLGVGYSRAAKLMDMLEEKGVIGHANGSTPREVIIKN